MKGKLRLIVTNVCNRKCPGCCNVGWKYEPPIPMTKDEIEQYSTIIITGGEPMLYPEKLIEFMDDFDHSNFILYTASIGNLHWIKDILYHPNLTGLTFTIHDQKGLDDFELLYTIVQDVLQDRQTPMTLRLNIFLSDVVLRPMKFYGWDVKIIEWITDCPKVEDEDFGVLISPWGDKKFGSYIF